MTYPGNPALSAETKKRLLTTFEQTLDLAQRGSQQEALLGCDFILRMDPLFEPARTLLERLDRGSGKAVDIADLRPGTFAAGPAPASARPAAAPPPRAPQPSPAPAPRDELSFADLDENAAPASMVVPPSPARAAGDLRAALERALAERRFQDAMALAEADRAALAADPGLLRLAQAAQSALEAEPYVRRFLDGARQALAASSFEECERLLQKARALDAAHPELAGLERQRAEGQAAASGVGWQQGGVEAPAAVPAELDLDDSLSDLTLSGLILDDPERAPSGLSLAEPVAPIEEPAPPSGSQAVWPDERARGSLPALEPPAGPPPAPPPAPEISLDLTPAAPRAGAPAPGGEDPRIAQLLAEGQAAFERGEHQTAVDAWSRIFLIDIDHTEAARRIEQARNLKAEAERKLEEIFHDGLAQLDAGEVDAARSSFSRVLELQPNHLAAREQLQLMQSGQAAKPRPAAPRSAPASEAPRAGGARDQGILKEEILVPPEPGAVRPRAAEEEPLVLAQAASPRRRFLVIGTAVLVLALAGGAVLWTNRDRFFPNSRAAAPAPAPAPDPIARATRLHEEGKTAIAVSQLRRLPPNDPQYDRAQALIAEWETLEAPAASPAGPSPELLARRDGLAAQARAAYDSREYVRAAALFEQAAAVAPLDEATAQLALETRQAAEPLAQQVELFRQGEWEYVLPALWRLREEQPQNRDVTRLIVDSYYNLGVRDLQREDPAAAVEKLKEALLLAGDDRELERLSLFAQTYAARQQDLLYRTYVKYLPFR